jgi:hypothetical protein
MAYPPVPEGPITVPPSGYLPEAEQLAVLLDALAGVELGAWDESILEWLAGWDWPTVATVASLIKRARRVGDCDVRAG